MESPSPPPTPKPSHLNQPSFEEIAAAHELYPWAVEWVADGWHRHLVSDDQSPDLPQHTADSFVEGYTKADPRLIHRAFHQWHEDLTEHRRLSPYDAPMAFFGIPGTDQKRVRALRDLDNENAKRLNMVRKAAHCWGIDLLFATVKATWRGRPASWVDLGEGQGHAVLNQDGTDETKEYTGILDLFNGLYHASTDWNLGLVALNDLEGSTIVPARGPGPFGTQVRLDLTQEYAAFWQKDMFELQPNSEKIFASRAGNRSWVEKTWYKDVS